MAPILNFQKGIHPDDTRFTDLRTLGGLLVQPFFDTNNNGQRDPGEALYLDNPELLLVLNNKPIKTFRPDTRRNGLYVRLSPDTYRLDLDPAGYPLDWKPTEMAYAVEVVPGSYTPVLIPLTLAYSVTGVLTDRAGVAIGGARVEAVPTAGGLRKLSVTNGAGVFVLENLSQGTYQLLINGQPAQPDTLTIDAETPAFQEINLQLTGENASPPFGGVPAPALGEKAPVELPEAAPRVVPRNEPASPMASRQP
ncbi:carboxypeptidase regulatory-like domain-containing protein [Trichothermofontia sp.]